MTRIRVGVILGVALLVLAAAWSMGALAVRRPPPDLGPAVVVPTAPGTTVGTASPTASGPPNSGPTPSIAPTPSTSPSTPTSRRASEAIPVSKSPVPAAGDDVDNDRDDLDDDFDEDDVNDDDDG